MVKIAPPVPQQDNAVDCAIFTIAFGVGVMEGQLPDNSDFEYTPRNAQDDRVRIANRLNEGICGDPENTPDLFPPVSLSAPPPSPALSTSFEPTQCVT